jgi:histidinol phosphatase-like enzyme
MLSIDGMLYYFHNACQIRKPWRKLYQNVVNQVKQQYINPSTNVVITDLLYF